MMFYLLLCFVNLLNQRAQLLTLLVGVIQGMKLEIHLLSIHVMMVKFWVGKEHLTFPLYMK